MRRFDDDISDLIETCGDALLDQCALAQTQAATLGVDLNPFKEELKKEMAEKKERCSKLKLQRKPTILPQEWPKENSGV